MKIQKRGMASSNHRFQPDGGEVATCATTSPGTETTAAETVTGTGTGLSETVASEGA